MSRRLTRRSIKEGLGSLKDHLRDGKRHPLIGQVAAVARDYILAAAMPKSERLRTKLASNHKSIESPLIAQVVSLFDSAFNEIL